MNKFEIQAYGKYKQLAQNSKQEIFELKNRWKGEDVYCLGTGPSVKDTNLNSLKGKCVIYLNNSIDLRSSIRSREDMCFISDHLRMSELRSNILSLGITTLASSDKIFNHNVDWRVYEKPALFIMPKINANPRSNWISMNASMVPGFSKDLTQGIFIGKSVVFSAIQTAVYLGAKNVYLAGVDMTMNKAEYFSKTTRSNWSEFDYTRDGIPHFHAMHEIMSSMGVSLINASQGGALDAIPRNHDLLRI